MPRAAAKKTEKPAEIVQETNTMPKTTTNPFAALTVDASNVADIAPATPGGPGADPAIIHVPQFGYWLTKDGACHKSEGDARAHLAAAQIEERLMGYMAHVESNKETYFTIPAKPARPEGVYAHGSKKGQVRPAVPGEPAKMADERTINAGLTRREAIVRDFLKWEAAQA